MKRNPASPLSKGTYIKVATSLFSLLILGKEVQSTRRSICQKKFCPSLLLGGPMWHRGHMGSLSPSPSRISPLCCCQETELGSAHRCWMDHVSRLASGTQAGVTHQLDLTLDPLSPSQRSRRRACPGRHNSRILDPEVKTLKQAWAHPGQSNTTPPSAHCEHRYVCCAPWHSACVRPLKIRQHNGLIMPRWKYPGSFD